MKCRKMLSCAGFGFAPAFCGKVAEFAPEVADAAPARCGVSPAPGLLGSDDVGGVCVPKPP